MITVSALLAGFANLLLSFLWIAPHDGFAFSRERSVGDSPRRKLQERRTSAEKLVDNAWDADARTVDITLPTPLEENGVIIVADTGTGMSHRQIETEYLDIARDRRKQKGERTAELKRYVKGRKGVGKFAGLIAAGIMEVETKQNGQCCRFAIDRKTLEDAPAEIGHIDVAVDVSSCGKDERGTIVRLRSLSQAINYPTTDALRHFLAPDYGREEHFLIRINGEKLHQLDLPGQKFSTEQEVPGVGTVKIDLVITEQKLAKRSCGILVRVKGKPVGPPRFFGTDNDELVPRKLLQHVSGILEADSLEEAATTTGWTDFLESDKRFEATSAFAARFLKEKLQETFQQQMNLAKARWMKKYHERLRALPEHRRAFASQEIERILYRYYGDSDERIEASINVLLMALEKDDYWLVVKAIDEARPRDIASLAEALNSFGLADLALVARSARARLKFLDTLGALINDESTLEKTIHRAIENNLWLFGSDYALLVSNRTLQTTIDRVFGADQDDPEARRRPDLLLAANFRSRYVLVEFKRPAHPLTWEDKAQAERYRSKLLAHASPMDILVLGGKRIKDLPPEHENGTIRVHAYTEVVARAENELRWLLDTLRTA